MALTDSTQVKHILEGKPTAFVTVKSGQTIAAGDLVGYNSGWVVADESDSIAARFIAFGPGVAGDVIPVGKRAHVSGFTGGTAGGIVYLGESGKMEEDVGTTYVQPVGISTSATEADIDIQLPNTIGTGGITNGAILNEDVNTAAAIAYTKLAALTTGHVVVGVAGAPSTGTLAAKALLANTKFLIGDTNGVAQEFTLSGDVTNTAGGAVTIGATKVLPSMLKATLQTGVLQLPLVGARVLAGGTQGNLAAHGGQLASDSTPILSVAAGIVRVNWAATVVNAISWGGIFVPPDCASSTATLKIMAAMSTGPVDHPGITAAIYDKAGTDLGGGIAHIIGATYAEYALSFTIPVHPDVLSIAFTPDAHNTDAIYLIGAWIEYARA
jgi:hypothetical protein